MGLGRVSTEGRIWSAKIVLPCGLSSYTKKKKKKKSLQAMINLVIYIFSIVLRSGRKSGNNNEIQLTPTGIELVKSSQCNLSFFFSLLILILRQQYYPNSFRFQTVSLSLFLSMVSSGYSWVYGRLPENCRKQDSPNRLCRKVQTLYSGNFYKNGTGITQV